MDVTAKIARFVVDTQYETIPPKALETAKAAMLDESSTRRVLETIESLETLEDIRPLCRLLMG